MPPITLCAKFDLFPDGTVLGTSFNHSGFTFSAKGLTALFVNNTSGEKGIRIPPPGITVELIAPSNHATFRVGIWDGKPITVTAKDVNGVTVSTKVITGHNQYIDSFINGRSIKYLDFDVTGHEEMLISVCINI